MKEPTETSTEPPTESESSEPVSEQETPVAAAPVSASNRNEVLSQVSAKFVSDVSSVWGSALSLGKNALEKVEKNEYVKQATTVVTEAATSGVKLIENAPLVKDGRQNYRQSRPLASKP